MCIANILIISSFIILLFIIINGYITINNTETFHGRRVGRGGRGRHYDERIHNYRGGYTGNWGGGYGWLRDPYYWSSWLPYYNNRYGYGYDYDYWRQCPQGTWCPSYLDCNSPECN
tara:strand:- start:278 stop:625 length:348 start_codon:yes stop_codon:yes gene_type:complete